MLSMGFVSAAPPVKGAPPPGAPVEAGASEEMAAFDAALASTLAVIEQEAQRADQPASDEPSASVDWLLAPLFALPADVAPAESLAAVQPTATAGDGSGIDVPSADAAGGNVVPADATAIAAAAQQVAIAAGGPVAGAAGSANGTVASVTMAPAPQAQQRGATAQPQPADAGSGATGRVAGGRETAVATAPAIAADREVAAANGHESAEPAANGQRGTETQTEVPAAPTGVERRYVPRSGQHVPATAASAAPSGSAAAEASVAAAAPVETATVTVPSADGKNQDISVTVDRKAVPGAPRAEAAVAATPQFAATPSASKVASEAAAVLSSEQQAALAAVQPASTPGVTAKTETSATDAQIRTGAAIEQAGSQDTHSGADAGTSQGQGRPSQEFMRFAAALAQAAPAEAGRTEPIVRSTETAAVGAVAPTAAANAPIATTPAAATAVTAPPPAADAENVGRLVQAMRVTSRQGGWEATVRLNPDHLGEVTIALRVDRNAVSAVVNAEAPGVRQWLESQEQAVRSGMAEHGLQLERFVVQRDGQRKDPQPQQQEGRRQPQKRHDAAQRFEVVV